MRKLSVVYRDNRLVGASRLRHGDPKDLMYINDEVRDCVVFLGVREDSGNLVFRCTAFLVSTPLAQLVDTHLPYLVTARHNVERMRDSARPFVARINMPGGKSEVLELKDEWSMDLDTENDVAVMPFAVEIKACEQKVLPRAMFLDDESIQTLNIGIGQELFVTGLFHPVHGKDRNMPLVRTGHIAAMPSEDIPDERGSDRKPHRVYLAEVRSLAGLSGSPVFAYITGRGLPGTHGIPGHRLALLGVIRGHWGDGASQVDRDVMNYGIARVTPIQHVASLLDHPEEMRYQEQVKQAILEELGEAATLDSSGK